MLALKTVTLDVTLPKTSLVEVLTHAAKCTAGASVTRILHCTRLIAVDGHLAATATDLAKSYEGRRPATVTRVGGVCVSATWLRDVVRALPEGDVRIVAGAGDKKAQRPTVVELATVGHRRRFQLPAIPGEDYPEVPRAQGEATQVDGASLTAALRSVEHAAGEAWPDVSVAREGSTLRARAFEATRMAVARGSATGSAQGAFWVPAGVASRLSFEGPCQMVVDSQRVTFETDSDRWTCTMPAKEPPATLGALVAQARAVRGAFVCDRSELLSAMSFARLVTKDRVELETLRSEKCVRVTARSLGVEIARKKSPGFGVADDVTHTNDAAADEVSAMFEGEVPEKIGVNVVHFVEALSTMTCARVEVRIAAGEAVGIFDPADDGRVEITMPFGDAP